MNHQQQQQQAIIQAARSWQQYRAAMQRLDPDDEQFDQIAEDFHDAEAALALAVRQYERTNGNGANKP